MDDWEEDWDGTATNGHKSSEREQTSGKIFGTRGRGFSPVISEPTEPRVGKWPATNGHRDDGNKENGDKDWTDFASSRRGRDKDRADFAPNRRGDGPRKDREPRGEENGKTKPKSTYVPDDPTEDENEIFGTGISSGINFSKYDDIEVNVSGENPPKPITSFNNAGLRNLLVDLIKKCNYNKPTPIQKYAIPIIMQGRDMMACAQTGSGKTAAFLIPIIHKLLEEKREVQMSTSCLPQAIIVSPTRELTIQIFDEARKFSRGSYLRIAISYGGTAVFHQIQNIMKGCDILVATPGRLLDFIRRGKIELSAIRFLVLDEADRMLDMGFLPDMETLLTHETMVPSGDRQTLMFSATFPEEIQRLAGKFLNNYLFVAVGIVGGACADVEQRFFSVTKFEKRNKLVELLTEGGSSKCLIFVEQKRTTDFIATFLCEKNFPATSIHGDREQREREEALRDFKRGHMDILVATSVAARGLDIKNVAHVINFDLPKTIDEYVHRIGRTGRVGNRGLATSFYDPDQDRLIAPDLVKILNQAGQPVPDFLKAEGSGSSYGGPARFGGSDFRNKNSMNDIGRAQESTFEEEVW